MKNRIVSNEFDNDMMFQQELSDLENTIRS
jgi:hypothetical protein